MRHARERKAHLDARERAREHQVVEVAKVPDPEHLALEPPEPRAEREVERGEDPRAQRVGVVARGHQHRRERAAVLGGCKAQHLEAPRADRAPRRLAVTRVAREHTLEALLRKDLE